MSLGLLIVWGLAAAALLWLSWNRVIAPIWKLKEVKFWHALLIIGTVAVLCAPRYYMKRHKYKGHGYCPYAQKMHHGYHGKHHGSGTEYMHHKRHGSGSESMHRHPHHKHHGSGSVNEGSAAGIDQSGASGDE